VVHPRVSHFVGFDSKDGFGLARIEQNGGFTPWIGNFKPVYAIEELVCFDFGGSICAQTFCRVFVEELGQDRSGGMWQPLGKLKRLVDDPALPLLDVLMVKRGHSNQHLV
jgi:hypothetical protein